MSSNPLYLLVGKSASGKTTIATFLEKMYGHKSVASYTTRKPRYHDEAGHIFITEEEFDNLGELAAFTEYNKHRYGVTYEQIDQCSVYVVDIPGVESLLENLNGSRPIRVIYFDAAVSTRIDRMIERGASDMEIVSRLHNDDTTYDWYGDLDRIICIYRHVKQQDVKLYMVNANENINGVLNQTLSYINESVME